MIKKCTCEHEYQDKKWGNKLRVHNPVDKDPRHIQWRCTVCKTVRD